MKNVMWFEEIRKENLAEVGGKGANLGEMTAANFPIPGGFVVTAGAYFDFIKRNRIDEYIKDMTTELDIENSDKLMRASEMVKGRILGGLIPDAIRNDIITSYRKLCAKRGRQVFVAVRSSATAEDLPEASFAGQQSTFLNVQGEGDVVQNVKECWASLFEPRSIYYRTTNKFDHLKVGLAAVVQEMVQSEVAGVMFTVDPVTQDLGIVSIESAYGLGEVVVSGSVTPDRYLVRKGSWRLETKEVARQTWMLTKVGDNNEKQTIPPERQEKAKLSDSQIIELAKIGCAIEAHYGKPQDTEWALQDGTLFIVQARPVTTLKGGSLQTVNSGRYAELIKSEFRNVTAADSNPMDNVPAMTASPSSAYAMSAQSPAPAPTPAQHEASESAEVSSEVSKPVSSGGVSMNLSQSSSGQVLLTGLPASPGVGKGKVRILASHKEMNQMQAGEILVTEMTTPDFVPAMKKAVAIVTNTGGMTCHAAIV